MAEARLSILISALDKTAPGLTSVRGRLADLSADTTKLTGRLSQAAAMLVKSFALPISVVGIAQFVRSTVNGVDALNDLSDATGASIENISALEDIAARTGTTMDTVGSALVKFNRVLADAEPNSPMARALQAIGLSSSELRKLDPAEALRRTAVALAGYADDGDKARLVQELFGKSVREVAPLLKDLSAAGKLNATVTADQAKAAEELNKQLSAIAKNATDAAREVSGPLVNALNRFFGEGRMAEQAGYSSVFDAMLSFNTTELSRLNDINGRLTKIVTKYGEVKSIVDGIAASGKTAPAELQSELARLDRQEKFLRLLQQSQGAGAGRGIGGPVAPLPSVPTVPGGGAKASRDRALIGNSFDQATIAALRAMENTDTNKLRDLNLALSGLFELQRETRGDPAVAQAIGRVRAEIEALSTKPMPDAGPVQAYTDALAALQGTNAVRIAELSATLDELFKLRAGGLFGPEVEEAIGNLRDQLEGLKQPLADVNTFALEAGKNIQNALGDSILASLEGSTKNIGRIWGDMLKRMAAQAAGAQLGRWLLGGDFGKTGAIGGATGDLFKWLGSFGGARADGGPVTAGRPYLVGERGPEIVVPKTAGTVLPNGTGLAGGNTFNVIVQGDASENTLRLIRGALAQYEARMLMSGA